jgi:hypothetical protein
MKYKNSLGSDIMAGRRDQCCGKHTNGSSSSFSQVTMMHQAATTYYYRCASFSANLNVLNNKNKHMVVVSYTSVDLLKKKTSANQPMQL